MQKFPRCWDLKQRIEYLQRRIIIASILYYEFDWSPITDHQYEELNKQLLEYMKDYSEDIKETKYGYCMGDYDGSTGFDLYHKLCAEDKSYLTFIAKYLKVLDDEKNTPKKEVKKQTTTKRRLF